MHFKHEIVTLMFQLLESIQTVKQIYVAAIIILNCYCLKPNVPRKGQNTSVDKSELVIYHKGKDKSYRETAQLLMMKKSTVANIIKR